MVSDSGKRVDALDTPVLELKVLRQALEQSIVRVDEELAALAKERQRLSNSIRERQSVLSALRHMPKEILAHIFFHTLVFPFPQRRSYGGGLWQSVSASRHPLLPFEMVSRNWKDVLDTLPNMWSYVNIIADRMSSITYAHYIGNQLSRSRLCPLSVSICYGQISYRPNALPNFMLVTLFSISSRIQNLHLCLPSNHFAGMQWFHLSFPVLQELVLFSSYETSEVAQHLHFGSLPNLRVFHATDISNIDKLSLPWHQITHFTSKHEVAGRGLSAPRALRILKMMSCVSVCCISLDLKSTMTGDVGQITFSQLHSLTFSSVSQDVIPPVLNSLILPALLDLSVMCFFGSNSREKDTTFTSVRQLIERSHSPLTSLYFDKGDIMKDDLVYILSNTHTLQDLRLTDTSGITDEVLDHLARRVDPESDSQVPALVPRLHTLHFSGYLEIQVEVYVQMVESRWTCHPRYLKSVNLDSSALKGLNKGAGTSARSRLYALRSEGLEVVLRT
ncbi:hypothetical protein F5146DRAFT_1225518 [Armillaria mellea]|nr:hypothetical protein F5146DRAFT_1225518 [Armillaria mellea]